MSATIDRTRAHERERQRVLWYKPSPRLATGRELVVDGFAGGGGASLGISRALGHGPDVAINHDANALSMHQRNHPGTRHICENIWNVQPREVVGDRPVGFAWFSPDCTHFSKAAGKQPTSKRVRCLANVVLKWAASVKPRVIFMENVEEFQTWGPVDDDGIPIPKLAGTYFARWLATFRKIGYEVELRVLSACDYGAPTIRKRLFIIARCDGKPIVWPEPTHANPKEIKRALREDHHCNKLPWRTAAECIDWSIPCPSIFLNKEEAKAAGCKRPLADKTMQRIANGVRRYVIEDRQPFLVFCNHGGDRFRGQGLTRPMGTLTTSRDARGLIVPFVQHLQQGGRVRQVGNPMHTIAASRKDCNLLVAPFVSSSAYSGSTGRGKYIYGPKEPLRTLTSTNDKILIAPVMTAFHSGTRWDRSHNIDDPLRVQDTSNRYALVAAFIAKHFGGMTGARADRPYPTVTTRGTQNQLCVSFLNYAYTSNTNGGNGDLRRPAKTVLAGGTHAAEVRAFLINYYSSGSGKTGASVKNPLPTITTKDRMGLVTIQGQPYKIVDIGMRMLTPRELFRAQGFPDSYDISTGINGKPLTKTQQVAMCGNSVCPDVAESLVRANVG